MRTATVYTVGVKNVTLSASAAGVRKLYTEDLQSGREIRGLRIENPFA